MKLFNILFLVITEKDYVFLKYRHKIDSAVFSGFNGKLNLSHLKLYDGKFIPDEKNEKEYFFKGRRGFFNLPFTMCLFIKRQQPEVVMLHGFVFPVQLLLLRLIVGGKTKIIVQHHAEKPYENKIKLWLQRLAYSNVDAYLFTSAALANTYTENRIIVQTSKIHEVMEGSSSFIMKDKSAARKKLNLPETELFLWVGRLDENKDPFTFLKAIRDYKNAGKDFMCYMIYGTYELEEEVKSFIVLNGLGSEVTLIGRIPHPELEDWFNAADYFISASHYEGGGIATCEAMGCGCVPILSAIPSFINMTNNGTCGYLFEVGNDKALLQVLLNLNPFEKVAMRKKVLAKFDEDLSFKAIGLKISKIADALVGRNA